MNIYLQSIFPERSRKSLNRLRNRCVKWDYKGYVRKALDELRNAQVLATVGEINANVSSGHENGCSKTQPLRGAKVVGFLHQHI